MITQLFSDPLAFIVNLMYRLPAVILALTVHEAAHGLMAFWLGDPTARDRGRLSLNPLRHLDPMGMLMLIFLGFGWAKPVPVNPSWFKKPRRDDMLVALAGPLTNLLMFFIFCMLYWTLADNLALPGWFMLMLEYVFIINLYLGIFNLLPIPPLDGYHVLNGLVLKRGLYPSQQMVNVCMLGIFVLSMTGILGNALSSIAQFLITRLAQLYVFIAW